MRGIVPDAILDRRDKVGFATPQRNWLRELEPWIIEVLRGEEARTLPMFRADSINERMPASFLEDSSKDVLLWRWLNLARWAAIFNVRFD